jgi:carboxymethylenebutenolidase
MPDEGQMGAYLSLPESGLDAQGAVEDAVTALHHLEGLPETTGPVGVLGFCLRGTLAYGVAQLADPATAVAYSGSGIADMLEGGTHIACPVLFQFGGEDPYIPRDQAELVAGAAEARAGWEVRIHDDAGHAFDNWDAPMFSRPEPAKRAWAQTTDSLSRTLPST